MLMEHNHDALLFPDWSNSLDYADANESFGTIALHTEALQNSLDDKNANYDEVKLTPDQKWVAKAMGTKLPFLPTSTKEEQKLFSKLYYHLFFNKVNHNSRSAAVTSKRYILLCKSIGNVTKIHVGGKETVFLDRDELTYVQPLVIL